jgi:hypothetical protein
MQRKTTRPSSWQQKLVRVVSETGQTENLKKRPRKSPKRKKKREEQNQALRNHVESSIHTMKVSYKI